MGFCHGTRTLGWQALLHTTLQVYQSTLPLASQKLSSTIPSRPAHRPPLWPNSTPSDQSPHYDTRSLPDTHKPWDTRSKSHSHDLTPFLKQNSLFPVGLRAAKGTEKPGLLCFNTPQRPWNAAGDPVDWSKYLLNE